MTEQIVSGAIVFSEDGLRSENYFIKRGNTLTGLDTDIIEPEDLRKLADHLEQLRSHKNKEFEYVPRMNEASLAPRLEPVR